MKRWILWLIACCLVNALFSQTKKPLPVIDMHFHAMHANDYGSPPRVMPTPFRDWGYNDPKNNFGETLTNAMQKNLWSEKSIKSPTTDDSLQSLSIDALERRNVYAVTSGDIDMVRKWKKAAPDRIINGVGWSFSDTTREGLLWIRLKRFLNQESLRFLVRLLFNMKAIPPAMQHLIPICQWRRSWIYLLVSILAPALPALLT